MLIDWFTIGAQTLNFIILVWLLKRFLYKPILNAVDTREKLIATRLADADAKEAKAQSEGEAFQQKNATFDKERAALLTKAADEAATQGHKLLEDARKAADALSAKRRDAVRQDAHTFNQAFRERMQQEVFATARKVLTDLAATDLEDRMTEVFTRRLGEMAGERKATFGAAVAAGPGPALLRSAFALAPKQQNALQASIDQIFSVTSNIRFETVPNLLSGLELSAGGQKVSWSVSEYISSLESDVSRLLGNELNALPKASSKITKAELPAKIKARAKPQRHAAHRRVERP